ncbi:VOC family protein [Amycolatopsis sp. cmx-4-68]|uniref:VOC family protein n=1 Tax=Amycolatopsis sp. cmx-4-68 TaxID=2790938 RepID=UPI00397E4D12
MSIFRLNHAVLYVRDLAESVAFYRDVLGFGYIEGGDAHRGAAFLRAPGSANDHDLGLFEVGAHATDTDAGRTSVGLYHLAWEVDTLGDLERLADRLAEAGALVGSSDHGTTKSLYAKDPSGIEFEVVWIIPRELLTETDRAKSKAPGRLDLTAELAKYGPDARSGVGISRS